jgi:hypothetical protein
VQPADEQHPTVDLGDACRRQLVRPFGIVLDSVCRYAGAYSLDKGQIKVSNSQQDTAR